MQIPRQRLASFVASNMKKTFKHTITWTVLVFVGLTLLTMKNKATSDGLNSYGFPFTFYDEFIRKCERCYERYGFKLHYLLADTAIAASLVFFIARLKSK